ncbi:similar to Saccharomyces cerevisiae YDL116W NUP84 Subunit of the nuclear pore complex (NPC) [Maudiozyma saulgeensis]|uniref:Nuclear pore complex protein n=1 Tax=Maudiozyma saulgeensis TaxID=1789683 RepID=A0A1X7QZK7_9SACH|nr:similar to Saccharomyces cerevisiae YDL116W NUP84 Subunit of the nuclear pore complex (NPC) [Kazachstania saulgeensis]
MEVDNLDDGTVQPQPFVSFTNVLKDYVTEFLGKSEEHEYDTVADNDPDPFDIIKEFRSIAAQSAAHLISSGKGDITSSNDWELEARFWHLLDLLLSFRVANEQDNFDTTTSSHMSINSYNSNAVFEKKLMHENKSLYQIWIIIVWLQQNMPEIERPENLMTSKWSNSLIAGGLKSADLDYPLRDPQNSNNIDIKDKEQDHIFFQYIYNLLIAGKFEEAFEECRVSENLTLCMIMCGMQEYLNPKIDEQLASEFDTQLGIKKHTLWRSTVYNLSQQTQLDAYERAIYSFLSGTMPNDDVLAETNWETELLLNLNQIIQIEVDNYLLKEGKGDVNEIITPIPRQSPTLETVLNVVSSKHMDESTHPVRTLVGSVILNTLPTMIHSSVDMLLDIVRGFETSNDLLDEPYLLRIVTHLAITLDIIEPGIVSTSDKVKLVTAYISVLKLHGLYESIPVYISFLGDSNAVDAYSFILCTIEDSGIRESQLDLMNLLRLPKNNILKKTTERVFQETESYYSPNESIDVTDEISDIDRHLLFGVEWLIEGRLYTDALHSMIAMSRRLLINGKVGTLQYFMECNKIEELIKDYRAELISLDNSNFVEDDVIIKEIQQYQSLVTGFKKYRDWQKAIKLLNSESNIPTLIEIFQQYSKYSIDLAKSFLISLTEDENADDFAVLYEIRALYTPYLIIELHKGLVEAAELLKIPTFISDALGFTNLVANETDKIYLLFQSCGRLKEYLKLVAHTATLVA